LDNILLNIVLLPLAVGFVLLFVPNKIKGLSKVLTLVISAITFIWAGRIFSQGALGYSLSIFQITNLKFDLLLTAKPLGSFMLLFACGFGLLITMYSLKSAVNIKRTNEYFGSILLAIGGSAGI